MIHEENGTVMRREGNLAWVRPDDSTACGACGLCRGRRSGEIAAENGAGAPAGARVAFAVDVDELNRGLALTMALLLASLLAGVVVGLLMAPALGVSRALTVPAAAMLGIAVSAMILCRRPPQAVVHRPRITRIIEE